MKLKSCIIISVIIFNRIFSMPDIRHLKIIHSIDKLEKIDKYIEFPEAYEKPFLKGIPKDLTREEVKKNKCGPHCWVPFKGNDPWYLIEYPRMPYLLKLSNYYIDPEASGTIFNDEQKLLLKYDLPYKEYYFFDDINLQNKANIIEIEKGLHLLGKCTEGYYHFLIEVLSRLTLVIDLVRNEPDLQILISGPAKKFMNEIFNLLGINTERIVYCENKYLYKVKNLYFPKPALIGYPSQVEIHRIRNELLKCIKKGTEKFNSGSNEKNNLIIVIERLEERRKATNTKELVKTIKKQFPYVAKNVVIFDGQISVKDQINLFSRAWIIIGPHGAGFSNMIFSSPGIETIEFIPENYFGLLFWHIASAMGNNHHNIIIPKADFYSSMEIPIKKVMQILNKKFESIKAKKLIKNWKN